MNPDFIVREMQALKVDIISDNMLAELSDIQQRHKKADRLLKYILRKGESACKCFLECFQGASIQASFILENLRHFPGNLGSAPSIRETYYFQVYSNKHLHY